MTTVSDMHNKIFPFILFIFLLPLFCADGFNIHTKGFAFINYNCVILYTSPVNIGKGVFIAPGVCIACSGHAIHPRQRAEGIGTSKPITIEDNVWIGANSTVCGGVTIEEGSIIGTGSVVNKDIPEGVTESCQGGKHEWEIRICIAQ